MFDKNFIFKGGDGKETEEVVDPNVVALADSAKALDEAKAGMAVMKADMEKLTASNKEMEGMLLNPSYTEFLADSKKIDDRAVATAHDEMTNGELFAAFETRTKELIQETVDGLSGTQAVAQAERDVAALRVTNPEFDLYAKEMVTLANAHPTLNVKQLFGMAKAEVGPRTAPNLKGGEVPNNHRPGDPPTPKGVDAQVNAAWKKSGIDKILKEV